jgi:hypothetical protein
MSSRSNMRTVHFDRAHADAKLERNDFARRACNRRDNDLTLPPAEGCDPLRGHQLLADPLMLTDVRKAASMAKTNT